MNCRRPERRLALYADAAWNMHPRQLLVRPRRLVPPRLLAAGISPRGAPAWRPIPAGIGVGTAPHSGPTDPPHATGVFESVGHRRQFRHERFWRDSSDGELFLFDLHGFSRLAEYTAGPRTPAGDAFWAQVVESWLAEESVPDTPAWHPYPTSVRITAWAAAISHLDGWPSALRDRVAAETWRQARYLTRTIEYEIGGNHLVKNAHALVVAGALFPDSRLLDRGLRLLRRELRAQILPDGGHEERSTSYHRVILDDLEQVRLLLAAARTATPTWLAETIDRMRAWQGQICGPDGRLPLLNDAWEGPPVGPASSDSVVELEPSGYTVLRHDGDQAVLNVGPIGAPHLPAHAHADALSFVLWDRGKPLIVDPGSFAYSSEWRDHFRSTAAHNTVEVDGQDQCVFWGDFRAARQPRVKSEAIWRHDDALIAFGSHDGYRRLRDPVAHTRRFVFVPGDGVVVVDRLSARRPHQICSLLHLAAGAEIGPDGRIGSFSTMVLTGSGPADGARTIQGGFVAPFLGTKQQAPVLVDRRVVAPGEPFGWSLLRGEATVLRVEPRRLTLRRSNGSQLEVPIETVDG
jgi:hypothetical protein